MIQEPGVLVLPQRHRLKATGMPTIELCFSERDTLPELLERRASELGITTEQLVKRFIASGLQDCLTDTGPSVPGESFEDFLVQNGVLKPRSDSPEDHDGTLEDFVDKKGPFKGE